MKLNLYNKREEGYFANINIFVFVSAVLSLISTCIFAVLPNTEYANSLDVPAKNALWILCIAPVLAFVAFALFSVVFFKNFPRDKDLIKALVLSLVNFIAVAFVFGGTLAYTINQWTLGFVAPTYDTPFETVKVIMIVSVCFQFLFGLSIIKTKRV